jgi:Methyltransferase FkbM domain
MSSLVRIFKHLARIAGNSVWVDKATNPLELLGFLSTLKPKKTTAPLVRIGNMNDGGYLLPNDFFGIVASISPGVAQEVTFDLQLAKMGMDIYMFDASVEAPPIQNPRFQFTKKFLDVFEDDQNIRIDSVVDSIPNKSDDLILQMDIEGAEWRVLLDASRENRLRFRSIVVEFHAFNNLFGRAFFRLATPVFKKLLTTHEIVHIHPNNCAPTDTRKGISIPPVLEFTMVRRDRGFVDNAIVTFPHALDADCVTKNTHVKMPSNWW